MNRKDLQLLESFVQEVWKNMPIKSQFLGTKTPLTEREVILYSYYEAVLTYLNKSGAIKDNWIEKNKTMFINSNSETEENDYL